MKVKMMILVIGMIAFTACGTKKAKTADDIVVDKLNNACDCLDAMDLIATETLVVLDKFANREEMSKDSDALNKYNKLESKLKDVTKRCTQDLKIAKEEAEKCPTYHTVKTKMDQVEEKL